MAINFSISFLLVSPFSFQNNGLWLQSSCDFYYLQLFCCLFLCLHNINFLEENGNFHDISFDWFLGYNNKSTRNEEINFTKVKNLHALRYMVALRMGEEKKKKRTNYISEKWPEDTKNSNSTTRKPAQWEGGRGWRDAAVCRTLPHDHENPCSNHQHLTWNMVQWCTSVTPAHMEQ